MLVTILGCSHSTNSYGTSWVTHMKNDLSVDILDISNSGASNEMLIEKLRVSLKKFPNTKKIIFQLTDPARMMLGLYGNNPVEEYEKFFIFPYEKEKIACHRTTNGISYLNLSVNSSDNDINKLLNTNYSLMEFFNKNVLVSDYNLKIKIFHTLMTIKKLCDFYDKEILFFSWFVDIVELAKEVGYEDILEEIKIVEGSVLNFIKINKIKPLGSDNLHYGTDEHKFIYENYLKSHICKFLRI